MFIRALFFFLRVATFGSWFYSLNYHFFPTRNGPGLNLTIFLGLLADCKKFELTGHFGSNWWWFIDGFPENLIGIHPIIQNHNHRSFWERPLSTLECELRYFVTNDLQILRCECLWVTPLRFLKTLWYSWGSSREALKNLRNSFP